MPTYGQEKYERETLARAEEINGEYEGRLSKAEAALTASEARVKQLSESLAEAIKWIENAPEDAWGYANDEHSRWPLRNELAHKLKSALGDVTATKGESHE